MPAPVPADTRNPQLLTVLFWGGVALAPVAALILLVADGNGPLRFAAVLAILAVVLIGLSITLRTEGGGRPHAEELRVEIDELRRELRGEIVAAAQRGNQALDAAQRAQEALAGLRRRAESGGAVPARSEEAPGPGRARVPVPEPETPARYGERSAGQAGVYGAAQPGPAGGYGGYGGDRAAAGYGGDRPASGSAGVYGSPARAEPDSGPGDAAPRPLGVVRHTETVHVTTRHTVVDGGGGESGSRYGGYPARWSAQQPGERAQGGYGADREERSWAGSAQEDERPWTAGADRDDDRRWSGGSGQRDGGSTYHDDQPANRDDRDWGTPYDERGYDGGAQPWEAPAEAAPAGRTHRADDTGEYWAQLRAGDRWAEVRDDDRGRELRVGERRAEVHADPGGTEYRMEDRWASVRRDEPRRDEPRWGGDEGRRHGWDEPESPPALPAGGVPVPEEWRPPRQRRYQPEPARGYEPEPVHGYQSEPVRGQRPGAESYGRRHHAEESAYDGGANRWR
ncbi:hypothetical protein [Micromonospora sp. WMMD1082]|uniref:hypothetical protein n=1 Tax=Micromonospora sp. WMMD1082 TaxID=3016104 RepID=UPI002416AD49|nr:hypothetical protein [Micromonospora sp. WMMD1082]MDG4794342.1 hypothetical protein [Micromonospora sp. WMMD1082]